MSLREECPYSSYSGPHFQNNSEYGHFLLSASDAYEIAKQRIIKMHFRPVLQKKSKDHHFNVDCRRSFKLSGKFRSSVAFNNWYF